MNTNTINVIVGSHGTVQGELRTFSTGSKGWYVNGKLNVPVGNTMQPINLTINGQVIVASPKTTPSASGNYGWFGHGKVDVDGHKVQVGINLTACKCEGNMPSNVVAKVQVGGNLIIIGSKPGSDKKVKTAKPKTKAMSAPANTPRDTVVIQEPTPVTPNISELQALLNSLCQ